MARYIDDQDLSRVIYNGKWDIGGTSNEYNQTVTGSTRVGDSLTVTFNGTDIAVYGTFDFNSKGVVTTYSVDGAPPAQVTAPGGSMDIFKQQFWRSETIPYAEHKLVVNMSKVNSDPQPKEGTVYFDYFLVTDPSITSIIGDPETPTPTPSQSTSPRMGQPIGAIVGGIIGGLFFILSVVSIILFYYHSRRKGVRNKEAEDFSSYGHQRNTSVQPFMLTIEHGSTGNSSSVSTDQVDSVLMTSGAPVLPPRKSIAIRNRPDTAGENTQPRNQNNNPPSPESVTSSEEATSSVPKGRRSQVVIQPSISGSSASSQGPDLSEPRQHVDSGVRVSNLTTLANSARTGAVELPPVYSPV